MGTKLLTLPERGGGSTSRAGLKIPSQGNSFYPPSVLHAGRLVPYINFLLFLLFSNIFTRIFKF